MERIQSIPLQLKAQSEGVIAGYGSTFGNVDLVGDVIEAGAWAESLSEHQAKGTAPALLWAHDQGSPIGRITKFEETQEGLYVEGRLTMSVRRASEAFALAKDGAAAFSVGFRPLEAQRDSAGTNRITKAQLLEVSVVGLPANPMARITVTKSLEHVSDLTDVLRAEFGLSSREAKRLAHHGWHALRGEDADLFQLAEHIRASANRFKV